jgi:hypothetical protein
MDALGQKVLNMFVFLNKKTLYLHELIEAGGNDPMLAPPYSIWWNVWSKMACWKRLLKTLSSLDT